MLLVYHCLQAVEDIVHNSLKLLQASLGTNNVEQLGGVKNCKIITCIAM